MIPYHTLFFLGFPYFCHLLWPIKNDGNMKEIEEVSEMNEALIKLMKPELDAATANARKEGIAEGKAEGIAEGIL